MSKGLFDQVKDWCEMRHDQARDWKSRTPLATAAWRTPAEGVFHTGIF